MTKRIAFLFVAALAVTSVEADSFRCGRWVVSEDLSAAEIRKKCGEPDGITSRTEDVRGQGPIGTIKIGTTTIERWAYRRGTQAAPMVVTVVDGKVKSVLRGE